MCIVYAGPTIKERTFQALNACLRIYMCLEWQLPSGHFLILSFFLMKKMAFGEKQESKAKLPMGSAQASTWKTYLLFASFICKVCSSYELSEFSKVTNILVLTYKYRSSKKSVLGEFGKEV